MNIDSIERGQKVVGYDFPEQVGTVERVDYDDHVVWVRFELGDGRTSLDDIDPGDLRYPEDVAPRPEGRA